MNRAVLIADGRLQDNSTKCQVLAIRGSYATAFKAIETLKLAGLSETDAVKRVAKSRETDAKSLALAYALRTTQE